jgi:hypothetical protein
MAVAVAVTRSANHVNPLTWRLTIESVDGAWQLSEGAHPTKKSPIDPV